MIADRIRSIQAVSGGGGGGATDVYYAYRSLILNMQGTAGTAVFTDSSPNALTVTPIGDVQLVGDATFGTVASFDGVGDRLSIAINPQLDFKANDFTVEAWVYPTSSSPYQAIFNLGYDSGGGLFFGKINSEYAVYGINSGLKIASGGTVTLNTWQHVALTRQSGVFKIWVNGVQVATATNTTAINLNYPVTMGAGYNGLYPFTGLYGPLRVSPWAVYTSAFTPNQDLYPISQGFPQVDPRNSLILNMQGTAGTAVFTDDSPNALAVTPYGDAVLVSDATFGTVASFDGSGDYLTVANNAAFAFGAGDFTVELWYYYNGLPQAAARIFQTRNGDVYAGLSITHKFTNRGVGLAIGCSLNGSTWTLNTGETGAFSVVANAWTHVAVVRIGTSLYCYINGVQFVISTTLSGSLYWNSADTPVLGGQTSPSRSINALIGPTRITKGVARYTSNFTPPTGLFPTS